jgi:lysyl-tRNA synthetase class 2
VPCYALLSNDIDLGDYIGVRGHLMRTRTGELTVSVSELRLLTKALRPLPDKWHGLRDVEERFRQRSVDFAMNPKSREVLRTRSVIVQSLRRFLHDRGYLEVETPLLHQTPGGATAKPFSTHHNALGLDLFLRIAPELYLKRLLVGELGRVFEIGRVFRNEGLSRRHNPEFTLLEFYQAHATYTDLMDLTEEMLAALIPEIKRQRAGTDPSAAGGVESGAMTIQFQGKEIDFSRPWLRRTVVEAVAEGLTVETGLVRDVQLLEERARVHWAIPEQELAGLPKDEQRWPMLLMYLFDNFVQPTLINPTFITQYPVGISPLSRRNEADENFVDRFELMIAGMEFANAFSELNDPVDQHGRFESQLLLKEAGEEETHPMDEDYVRALEYGMPPAAGEGIGIDRLTMLLADAPSIREVIAFPLMRPERPGTDAAP